VRQRCLGRNILSEIQKGVRNGHPFAIYYRILLILRSHLWEEEYVLDGRGVGHEHGQTIDSHTES
jgi:hypothetical protein